MSYNEAFQTPVTVFGESRFNSALGTPLRASESKIPEYDQDAPFAQIESINDLQGLPQNVTPAEIMSAVKQAFQPKSSWVHRF